MINFNKKIKNSVNVIERYVLSIIIKEPKKTFDATVDGFNKAKLWAKSRPHPYSANKNLWDYAQNWEFDSYLTLNIINEHVKEYIKENNLN